jgi:alkanesulfonate monooxygenase SsuD/methylene tetrahydromethanopterin reductase-like flavin-dependent oxidoreductase (luciferase family)
MAVGSGVGDARGAGDHRGTSGAPEFHLFLPQMRLSPDALVARARAAEEAGFDGLALMDHLVTPGAPDQPVFEAFTTATWLAAATDRLRLGHLVLCDAFRHPAVLARQAVTLDHLSGGRYELGIGSGSTPAELVASGFEVGGAVDRRRRLHETLELLTRFWTGEPVHYQGAVFRIDGVRQLPVPRDRIPILIGGTGTETMALVARYADWWNVPVHQLDRRAAAGTGAGTARVSVQVLVTLITDESSRREVIDLAASRFGRMGEVGHVVGSGAEIVPHLDALAKEGVERIYTWFTDFGPPDTLAGFGREVIAAMRRPG